VKIIGLTGGIATGKSTAAKFLQQQGLCVLDADQVAHELLAPGKANYEHVVNAFGSHILASDKTIDRKKLGKIVFSNLEELRRLEALTHPAIRKAIEDRLKQWEEAGELVVVLDHPLLYEMNMDQFVDETWVVICSSKTQKERIRQRDGLTGEVAKERINAQMPLEEKASRARRIFYNDGSLEELQGLLINALEQFKSEHLTD
jgi:dephospho-CoA kinase